MKKYTILTLILTQVFILFANSPAETTCDTVDISWISSQIPLPRIARIILKRETGGLCEVVLNLDGNIVPVYAGNGFILAGQLFKNGKSVTQATLQTLPDLMEKEKKWVVRQRSMEKKKAAQLLKQNVTTLDKLVSLSYLPGKANSFIYVITDPRCSQCKWLLPRLKDIGHNANIQIKVIVYPLLGNESMKASIQAICSNLSFDQYLDFKTTDDIQHCAESDQLINDALTFFTSIGLSSVPAVVAGDGSWAVTNNDINQIKHYLGLKPDIDSEAASRIDETCSKE